MFAAATAKYILTTIYLSLENWEILLLSPNLPNIFEHD